MESKRNNSASDDIENYQEEEDQELELEEELEHEHEEEEEEEENNEILKRRISNHPLYGLLVEAHLDCLKVGDISNLDRQVMKIDQMQMKQAMKQQNLGMFSQSELDLFMEAYCMALGKLKEAMEEPQQKSMAFINNMRSQLRDLTKSSPTMPPAPPHDNEDDDEQAAPSTSSSTDQRKFRRN